MSDLLILVFSVLQRPPGQVQSQIPPGNIQMAARPQTLPTPQPQPFQPPMDVLPHDAAPTLYVDGMALDVSKREMSHIFRPFEGFKVCLLNSITLFSDFEKICLLYQHLLNWTSLDICISIVPHFCSLRIGGESFGTKFLHSVFSHCWSFLGQSQTFVIPSGGKEGKCRFFQKKICLRNSFRCTGLCPSQVFVVMSPECSCSLRGYVPTFGFLFIMGVLVRSFHLQSTLHRNDKDWLPLLLQEMRMVEKKDKNGKPLLIAFAEFETPHQAAASMKVLQDYPLDMSTPMENKLRLSYAKPLKSSDPRSRGQTAAGRPFAAPGGGGDQFR